MAFDRLKKMWGKEEEESAPEFIEIDLEQDKSDAKIFVKTFILKTYEDVNPILAALREGYTIAVIDIKQLKSKDVVELKRVISKVKKTVEALDGTIAGFGENTVIATPSFAKVQKGAEEPKPREDMGLEKF
jgi:SepF-like predicted cell division protein (DUF552 family)